MKMKEKDRQALIEYRIEQAEETINEVYKTDR